MKGLNTILSLSLFFITTQAWTQPTWVTSGAPIGDTSVYVYPGSWAATTLSLDPNSEDVLTVSGMNGNPNGVHIYWVDTVPVGLGVVPYTGGINGLGTNDRYFGVFVANNTGSTPDYTVTYDYGANPHFIQDCRLELYKRWANDSANWNSTGAANNTVLQTLTISDTTRGEYIVGEDNTPILTVNITSQTNVSCNGGSDGAIDITTSGGTGPYNYAWTGPGGPYSSQDLSGLAPGTYDVTVTDNKGCMAPASVTITEPTALSVSITAQTNVDCNGNSTGAVTVAGAGGTTSYQYDIGGAQQGSGTFSGLGAGSYTATVQDANGCTSTTPVTITEPAVLSGSITAQTNVDCNGNTTGAVTIAGAGGTTSYLYDIGGAQQGSGTFTGLSAGAYTVTIEDANGCTATVPVNITEPTSLTGSITAQTNVDCNGNSTGTVTIAGAGGTTSYLYDIGGAQQGSGTFTGLGAGGHTVTIEDANGCLTTVPVTITEPTALSGSVTAQIDVDCNGNSTGSVTVAGSGGTTSYLYDIGGAQQGSGTFPGLGAGSYTVTIEDANGCISSVPVTINEPTALSGNITAQTNVDCNGNSTGSVTVAGSGGTTSYLYDIGGAQQASGTFTGLVAGPYTVTIEDANGCITTMPVTVTEPTTLTGSITVQTDVDCNGNSTGSVTVAGAGGTTAYQYDIGGAQQGSGTFSGLGAGSYTVTVEDANGCITTVPINITEPAVLSGSITAQTDVDCNGNSTGAVTIAGTGGTTSYLYDIGGAQQGSGTFTGLAAGAHTVTIEDANGCITTVPVIIAEPTALAGSISAQTDVDCNGNATGDVTVMGNGGTPTYTYDIGGGSQASGTFSGLGAGSYTITVEDANGCTSTIPVTIVEPNLLSVAITAPATVCLGDTANVQATPNGGTGGYNHTWNTGGSGTQISVTITMDTTVIVSTTDGNGCMAADTVQIQMLMLQDATITGVGPYCENDAQVTLTAVDTGGIWSGTGITNGSSGTFDPATAGSGQHIITYSIGGSCGDVDTTVITINSLPQPLFTSIEETCTGSNDGSIDLTVGGGQAPYAYLWAHGPTSEDVNNLAPGTYTVTITDQLGCSNMGSVSLAAGSMTCDTVPGHIYIPNIFTPDGDGANDILFVRGAGIEHMTFTVYNRWGQVVFQTTDINTGWDGTLNGKALNAAVFVYNISGEYSSGDAIQQHGNVTLIR